MARVLFSGAKPSNLPHLGNYIGAIKNWVDLQNSGSYDCIFSVVDLHSITIEIDPKTLNEDTYTLYAAYLAAGVDPSKSILFVQSQVPEHAQLSWVLNCAASMGELSRMTQYKDKSAKAGTHIPAGLFTYPVLMAADVLLYQTEVVPVGDDQKQHVELTRDLALRMNHRAGKPLFKIPEPVIAKVGARIMDLQNPEAKMSKSDNSENGCIFLNDSDKEMERKIKRAVTDSGSEISYDPDQKAGVSNLLEIQAVLLGESIEARVKAYAGKQYGHLKVETAEIVVQKLRPIREDLTRRLADKGELQKLMRANAERASERAQKTLKTVYESVGFV